MGKGMVAFLRATLGFEPEIMREASERLADAESKASADQRKAQRDPQVHRSAIYPIGSEFALCHAQAQLMSAVVGVLNESLTESIRGFYKLRKAFVTLDAILAAEDKYMRGHPRQGISARASVDSLRSNRSARSTKAISGGLRDDWPNGKKQEKSLLDTVRQNEAHAAVKSTTNGIGTLPAKNGNDDDDDDDEFYDADESHETSLKTDTYAGHVEIDGITKDLTKSSLDEDERSETQDLPPLKALSSDHQVLDHDPDSDVFSNPIDVFIHSGANLCFGLLLVMISMIPPAFNRLLFIIGFHGDRDRGLRLLWQASKFHNINGAMAGLCLLGFYHQVIAFADILPESTVTRTSGDEPQQDVQGYPKERCEALLEDMRTRHPKSHLWLLEQARMEGMNRRPAAALSIIASSSKTKSPLKQVEALNMFEKALLSMSTHNYSLCAESFLNCVKLNNWSHTLYYYFAGACHVEIYRRCITSGGSEKEGKKHAEKAAEYLHQAPKHAGKKKFMARQLPFDVFVTRKIQKWDARSREWDVPFINAVGVSPLEEMIFLWNGYRRMDVSQFQTSLDNLKWSDDPTSGNKAMWAKEEADEKAVLAILRAATLRNLERWDEAAAVLQDNVLAIPNTELKGGMRDDWTAPSARYEMAVGAWMRRKQGGKEELEWVKECEGWIEKAAKWEGYELDARVGLKIATAQDTLKKYWEAKGV